MKNETELKEVENPLPHVALGMALKDGVWNLAEFRYNNTGEVEFVKFEPLNANKHISRDMWKVRVIERKIIS